MHRQVGLEHLKSGLNHPVRQLIIAGIILILIPVLSRLIGLRPVLATTPVPKTLVTAFEARFFKDGPGRPLPYRLLKPLNYQNGSRYPLVLFLHGSAENGYDNRKQLNYIVQIFEKPKNRREYPCFVMVPQAPPGENWVARESYLGTVAQSSHPTRIMVRVMRLLFQIKHEFPVDSGRIYVTGYSSGGSGTWDLMARYPGFFAAGAPFCGSGDATKASRIARTPIWAFHGGLDVMVNPNTTKLMVVAVQKAGGFAKATIYPKLFHNCWNKAFHDPEFFRWLFSQRRA